MSDIKRAIKVFKEKGAKVFFSRVVGAIGRIPRSVCAGLYVKFFIFRKKEKIIKEIADFHSDDGNKVFNFISKKYLGVFGTLQVKGEFVDLLKVVEGKRPKCLLEIGTAAGGTLFCFSKLAPDDATIISVDCPEGDMGGYPEWKIPFYKAFAKPGQQQYLLREDSHEEATLQKVKEILKGKPIDFLFIDGDHLYEGVKKDFEMYSPLVGKGGVVAFHDMAPHGYEGVRTLWNEVKGDYHSQEFVKDPEQTGYGIGCLFF
jgi:predicted O-methyltransferase YrrM